MSICPTCKGKTTVVIPTKTLAGYRDVERTCFSCYGSGLDVIRHEYKGLEVVEVREREVFVVDLKSDFVTIQGAKNAIDSVEKEYIEINADLDEDEKYPSLKEYCADYLAEM